MYLLKFDLTDPQTLLFISIISIAVWSFIIYLVVKAAFQSANKEIIEKLEIQNRLKIKELLNSGISHLEITQAAGGYYGKSLNDPK